MPHLKAPTTSYEVYFVSSEALSITYGDLSCINSSVVPSFSVDGLVTTFFISFTSLFRLLFEIFGSGFFKSRSVHFRKLNPLTRHFTVLLGFSSSYRCQLHCHPATTRRSVFITRLRVVLTRRHVSYTRRHVRTLHPATDSAVL